MYFISGVTIQSTLDKSNIKDPSEKAGPLQKVKIPKKDGQSFKVSYAFITFKHAMSVPYSIQLLDGIHLHGKPLKLQSRTGSVHQNPQNVELQRQMSGSSPRHHYGNDPSPSAMQRSTSRQGSYDRDRDRSRSHDRGHDRGSGSRDQNGGRDLSVISLSGQFSTNSPRPRDMDPLQTRRERILHNQAASLEIHRHRNDRHRAPNPYDRDPRQPWHQSAYRR
ncbi:hypothetical protein FSP39_017601 [Pinctada imbricata]|uniref:RRM domain-containing protein n=1 Tax=Pinctada imbricata TaxID=66713 RepID=A0AA88XLF7_PINIB|nr:hypothetical protein FSP39_017601 [Pinctada imbricata]